MPNRALAEERRAQLLELLYRTGQIRTSEISHRFGVSEVTARHDLAQLEKRGRLVRTHGGAVAPADDAGTLSSFGARMTQRRAEKRRIAMAASEFISSNETVIFDAGTTTDHLARVLPPVENLTVFTPGLNVAHTLMGAEGVEVYLLGGRIVPDLLETMGPVAEMNLEDLPVHKAFIGARGVDEELDSVDASMELAQVKRRFARMARQVVLLADSSKFHSRGAAKAIALRDVDIVVTDEDLPIEARRKIEDLGVNLIIA